MLSQLFDLVALLPEFETTAGYEYDMWRVLPILYIGFNEVVFLLLEYESFSCREEEEVLLSYLENSKHEPIELGLDQKEI